MWGNQSPSGIMWCDVMWCFHSQHSSRQRPSRRPESSRSTLSLCRQIWSNLQLSIILFLCTGQRDKDWSLLSHFENVHWVIFFGGGGNVLLVRFKPLGCWSTINAGSSRKLLLGILLLPWVIEILQLWFPRTSIFRCSSRSQMGRILRNANSKPWMCTWVVPVLFWLAAGTAP